MTSQIIEPECNLQSCGPARYGRVNPLNYVNFINLLALGATLFGVTTFLRQCNYLPEGPGRWSPHLVCRGDILLTGGMVLVQAKSTKTRAVGEGPVTLMIAPAAPGCDLCPVAACLWAWRAVPAPPQAPLFILPSTGRPLTAPALISLLREVLRALRHPA